MTVTDADGRAGRPFPVHPLLLATYPLLFLLSRNLAETPPGDAVLPLAVSVATTAVLLALLAWLLGDLHRAALTATIGVAVFFGYGHVRNLLAERLPLPDGLLAVGWLLLGALGVGLALRAGRRRRQATVLLNLLGGILVAFALVPIAAHYADAGGGARLAGGDPAAGAVAGPGRDIYYLVFDRYGAAATMQEGRGVDNAPFVASLRNRGFYVADRAFANHLKTGSSLASSLNLRYLTDLAEQMGAEARTWGPVFELLEHHAAGRFLQERGYTYVHIGSWWDPTQGNETADVDWGYASGSSDYVDTLLDTTILQPLAASTGQAVADHGRRHHEAARHQFEAIPRAAELPGQVFVFAHVLLPHEPYVFDAEGRFVADQRGRTREEKFSEQLAYTNREIDALLDALLDGGDDDPIVILSADEGPHPYRYAAADEWDWRGATPTELREKLGILNAFYLPGVDPGEAGLHPEISPVNTFRVLFNAYFGADLEVLPDRSWAFVDSSHPYDLFEVTDVLRR